MRKPGLALRNAAISMVAVLSSFGAMYLICMKYGASVSTAILSAALSVGLMRRPEPLTLKSLGVKFVTLPCIVLAAAFVGFTFLRVPILGAALFTGGIALSI